MIIRNEVGDRLDLTDNNIPQLLAYYGTTPDQVAIDSGDPGGLAARTRNNLFRSAHMTPPRYRSAVPSIPAVRAWVEAVIELCKISPATGAEVITEGPSLFLLGPTGTGKTYEAHGALRLLAASGVLGSVVVTSAPDMYADCRPSGGGTEAFNRYANARVLFLDDIGAAKPTEWVEETTYRLINHRYESLLPTLFTSNVQKAGLTAAVGERVMSRLLEMCERVVMDGEDRRRAGA